MRGRMSIHGFGALSVCLALAGVALAQSPGDDGLKDFVERKILHEDIAGSVGAAPGIDTSAAEPGALLRARTGFDTAAGAGAPGTVVAERAPARRVKPPAGRAGSDAGQEMAWGDDAAVSAAPAAEGDAPGRLLSDRRSSGSLSDLFSDAGDSTNQGWILRTLTALGVVLGLIFVVRFVYCRISGQSPAKFGRRSGTRVIEVLNRSAIAPRSHVLMLRIGQRILVVSESQAGMSTLANIDDPLEVADLLGAIEANRPTSITRGFTEALKRSDRDYGEASALDEEGDAGEYVVDRANTQLSDLLARVRTAAVE